QDPDYLATFGGQVASYPSSDYVFDLRTNLKRHHASYQADWRLTADASRGNHLLTLLADWDGERSTAEDRLAATQTVNSRDNFGVSAQEQMLWRRVFATLGGRVERNENFGAA